MNREEALKKVYSRSHDVPWQMIDDGIVLLELTSGHYYTLNDVGARIWELLDGEKNIDLITTTLNDEFDAPPETMLLDILELMDQLEKEGLVVTGNE
ncbi:PqqD family protein [candidate division CSSED10-310 bacterium]|uniref:PqqD family protein n=1 Tax=candidate division CSSED10-310 bacterium TaxID=2855610 RepID=A0ABV6Z0L5_UNCC1